MTTQTISSRATQPWRGVVAGLLVAAATQHVNADLAFLDLAEEALLADDGAALASLARPEVPAPNSDESAVG